MTRPSPSARWTGRAASAVLAAALAWLTACAGAPPRAPIAPAAESALEEARAERRAFGRSPGAEQRAAEALARAEVLAPNWGLLERERDQLELDQLLGPAVYERRLAAADSAQTRYLRARLEQDERGFRAALEADPHCALASHGLAQQLLAAGAAAQALAAERAALGAADSASEFALCAQGFARCAGLAAQAEDAADELERRALEWGPAAQQHASVRAAAAQLRLESESPAAIARGLARGFELLRAGELDAEARADLLRALWRARARDRERTDVLRELELALEPGRAEDDELRLWIALERGESARVAALASDEQLALLGSAARVALFAAGQPSRALEAYERGLPAFLRAPAPAAAADAHAQSREDAQAAALAKSPADPHADPHASRAAPLGELRALAESCAQSAAGSIARAAALARLGDALVAAGWYDEALAHAAAHALELGVAAEPLRRRALAGQQLVSELVRAIAAPRAAEPGEPEDGLDVLAARLQPALERAAAELWPADSIPQLSQTPRLRYGPLGALWHPGPLFSRADQRAGLGPRGAPVPGWADLLARLGRFGFYGEALLLGTDGCLLPLAALEQRSGAHLGVPFEGTVAWCTGAELSLRAAREGADLAGLAVHEGYWIDLNQFAGELREYARLEREFCALDGGRAARALAVIGPERGWKSGADRRVPWLGEGRRVALAVIAERRAAGQPSGAPDLAELAGLAALHEEGHLCERARFLPLASHWPRALGFAARCAFSPRAIMRQLEYRAELSALCEAAEPRLVLAEVLQHAEQQGGARTEHAAAYAEIAADLLEALEAALAADPAAFPELEPARALPWQLHRLAPESLRRLALGLARREGLLGSSYRPLPRAAGASAALRPPGSNFPGVQ